jgi:hypothetical protein
MEQTNPAPVVRLTEIEIFKECPECGGALDNVSDFGEVWQDCLACPWSGETLQSPDVLAELTAMRAELAEAMDIIRRQAGGLEECTNLNNQLIAQNVDLNAELAEARRERDLDGKFMVRGGQIIKKSSGEIVPDDEPLFLLRARDYLAPSLLEEYLGMCNLDNCTEYQIEGVVAAIDRFRSFQADHANRVKQPGCTRGLPYALAEAASDAGEGE